jgi:hypothetical protein
MQTVQPQTKCDSGSGDICVHEYGCGIYNATDYYCDRELQACLPFKSCLIAAAAVPACAQHYIYTISKLCFTQQLHNC